MKADTCLNLWFIALLYNTPIKLVLAASDVDNFALANLPNVIRWLVRGVTVSLCDKQ